MIKIPEQHTINNTFPTEQCLGVVLAGGLSSRMGTDKAGLQRNEQNMLSYSKQLLSNAGITNIVISGKPACASPQDILVEDNYHQAGPLGGIASVIEKYKPAALLILPVDLPLMTVDVLQKLKLLGELSQQACFYNDNFLPLYLPVNAHTENFIKTAFVQSSNVLEANSSTNTKTKNGPSMRALLKQVPHKAITPNNTSCLFNANTPEEWTEAQTSFTQPNSVSPSAITTNTVNNKTHSFRKPYV